MRFALRFAGGLCLLLALASLALAEEDRPWLQPGSRAGEEINGPNDGKLVWVPAGELAMGSEQGQADEQPVHRVRITRGFWLGKCEVTVAQWLHYCKVAKVLLQAEIITPLDHPMSGIDWDDCQAYCRYYGLSLPTEAQWEWAARGAEGRVYPWGNQWDARRCVCNDNPGPDGFTSPVGSYPAGASWCGALDMAGNLAEWCRDWYGADYYRVSPAVDPTGPEAGQERVTRGSYCWGEADDCRTARRNSLEQDNDGGSGGLRVCYVP